MRRDTASLSSADVPAFNGVKGWLEEGLGTDQYLIFKFFFYIILFLIRQLSQEREAYLKERAEV